MRDFGIIIWTIIVIIITVWVVKDLDKDDESIIPGISKTQLHEIADKNKKFMKEMCAQGEKEYCKNLKAIEAMESK